MIDVEALLKEVAPDAPCGEDPSYDPDLLQPRRLYERTGRSGEYGDIVGVERFGSSAPGSVVMEKFGFTVDNVVDRALALLKH
jgi:hypothetical protein